MQTFPQNYGKKSNNVASPPLPAPCLKHAIIVPAPLSCFTTLSQPCLKHAIALLAPLSCFTTPPPQPFPPSRRPARVQNHPPAHTGVPHTAMRVQNHPKTHTEALQVAMRVQNHPKMHTNVRKLQASCHLSACHRVTYAILLRCKNRSRKSQISQDQRIKRQKATRRQRRAGRDRRRWRGSGARRGIRW